MKVLEVRPGQGGEDSALFCEDITSAIQKWASQKGMTVRAAGDHTFTVSGKKEYV